MKKRLRRLPPIPSLQFVRRLLARAISGHAEAYPKWTDATVPRSLVVVGDLQRTILAEQLYLGRRQNDAVREALLRAISDERPDVLLLLGDQVADGASDREWNYFDRLTHSLREHGTCFHAILGNHDYSVFDRERSERNFFERFACAHPGEPELVRFGDVAYIGLDSNFGMLGAAQTKSEADSYRSLLRQLDDDESVRGVIVASHHPPFSNSRLRLTEQVVEHFAKPFLAARKTRLYLSAHVHSYERFERDGKMFVVSGGGGGPQRGVDVSSARRWRDDAFHGNTVRPFHYLRMSVADGAINVETMMLVGPIPGRLRRWRGSTPRFEVGDAFRLELGGNHSAPAA